VRFSRESIPKLDKRAFATLLGNAAYFRKEFGEPEREPDGFTFAGGRGQPLARLRVRYEVDKRFLGKVFAMVVEGRVAPGRVDCRNQRLELYYTGFVAKGMPFFRPMKGKGVGRVREVTLANSLNSDENLLKACRKLDLEYLRVFYDAQQELWRIQARPYGGSIVMLMVPPMRYNVMLPTGCAEEIMCVIKKIATLLEKG
jgi:hypothetical protein